MFRLWTTVFLPLLHLGGRKGGMAGGTQPALTQTGVLPINSIARWTLIHLGLLLLLLGSGFFLVSAYLLAQRFNAFESSQYKQDAERVAAVLEQDRIGLASFVTDYSEWDDSYQFMQDRNTTYIEANFTADTLVNVRANAVVMFTLNYEAALALELRDDDMQPMQAADLKQLKILISQPDFPALLHNKTIIIWFHEQPQLVAISDIINTGLNLPAKGHMLLIRKLDKTYLDSIRQLTGVKFNLVPVTHSTVATVISHHDDNWQASKTLNNQAAAIVINGTGRLNNERLVTNIMLAGNTLFLVTLSLFGIRAILNRRVLSRLTLFSALADRHRDMADAEVRWPVEGKDELDNLAASLNELMDEVGRHHGNLSYLAEHDALTDLGNRRQLMARLETTINLCRHQPEFQCSLLLIDLDSFKLINDGLGHAAGDWVLQEVAKRIRSLIRNSDTLVRLGGDEFALLLNQITPENAQNFAERVGQTLSVPASFDDRHLTISASIGIAQLLPDIGPEDVLRNADLAMYEAKRLGKHRTVIFDESLLNVAARRLRLEQALQSALDNDALDVWFQPIINARDNSVSGMEALLRWSLEGCFIPPDEFIKIAENNGTITLLGRFVLERACVALKTLRNDYPQLSCNINISLRQFVDIDLGQEILACLQEYELPPSALHLELTESMVAIYENDILPTMKRLVASGLKFHLDDFGTGYSSLERLRKLPIDTLKIDRSFVTPLREGDDVMVRSIINLGRELGMKIIAEGVEDKVELDKLMALGCNQMQGYFYARPMSFSDLVEWLAQHNKTRHSQDTNAGA